MASEKEARAQTPFGHAMSGTPTADVTTDTKSAASLPPRDIYRRLALPGSGRDLSTLKILILSPAKTGNTWMKNLLATIYDLPIVYVGVTLDPALPAIEGLGERWIAHQHWPLTADLLRWGSENNATFVTTIRHPGDTLISLYHYCRNSAIRRGLDDLVDLMNLDRLVTGEPADDSTVVGKHLLWCMEEQFAYALEQSLTYLRVSEMLPIRYEDLWRDPVSALTWLTERIASVPRDRIERAIEACDISLMRAMAGEGRDFFRKGEVGVWRTELPPDVIELFRHVEPYPTYSALLGYTFDRDDPLTSAPAKPRTFDNPLRDVTHFANGVPVPPVVAKLYLSVDSEKSKRWRPITDIDAPDSFFAWITAPADADLYRSGDDPVITNLAAYLHHTEATLRQMFPDPFGADRRAYFCWFVVHAPPVYGLDRAFIAPVQAAGQAWLNAPSDDDPRRNEATLAVTNIAAHLYRLHPDLQRAFPDLFGRDRLSFAQWWLEFGRDLFALDDTLVPLTAGYGAYGPKGGPSAPWTEWLAAWRLADERSAASLDTTRQSLAESEQDREALRTALAAIEQGRETLHAHLAAIEQDRENLRTHLAAVEEDRVNLRDYLAALEANNTAMREYLATVEQDRARLHQCLQAVEEEITRANSSPGIVPSSE
ncbi:MAG: sulfotransferase domain-containing protein [Thermomicrobiales bacterium]